ncbi:MAG: hypothetical protein JSR78_00335 [Proteobacteria bacterium]|nr:hypothetical protein [Pseudomonadota bacterium]
MENFSMLLVRRWLIGSVSMSCFAVAATVARAETTEPVPSQKPPASANQSGQVPLSKKLEKNEGVIKPPRGIDPEIRQPPPERTGDKMPVIVPPGEPGGDQSIQPK